MKRKSGEFKPSTVDGEPVQAFVPLPIPPDEPPLQLTAGLQAGVRAADEALRALDLAGRVLPEAQGLEGVFLRREAIASAQLAGAKLSLVEFFQAEAQGMGAEASPPAHSCLDAMLTARAALASEPASRVDMHLLTSLHRRLVPSAQNPGRVRRTQAWIGGTRPGQLYVPPPPAELPQLLADFDDALENRSELRALIAVALLYGQFNLLHPYEEGNRRLARLLITALLLSWGRLSRPLLCPSLFIQAREAEHDRRLRAVQTEGDWEAWLTFFLDGLRSAAEQATQTLENLQRILSTGRERVLHREDATVLSLRLYERLPSHSILTVNRVAALLDCSRPAASKALRVLEAAEILHPLDHRKKDRTLVFTEYLAALSPSPAPVAAGAGASNLD